MEEAVFLNEEKGVENKGKIAEFENAVLKIAEEFKKRDERIKELEEILTKREEEIMETVYDKGKADEFENTVLKIAEEIKKRDVLIKEIRDSLAKRDAQLRTLGEIAKLEMGDIEGIDTRIKELQSTVAKTEETKEEAKIEEIKGMPSTTPEPEQEVKKGKIGKMFGWLSSGKSEQVEKREARIEALAAIKDEVLKGTSTEKKSGDGKEEIREAEGISTEDQVTTVGEEKSQAMQDDIKAMEARIAKLEAYLIERDEQLKRLEELLQKNIERAEAEVQATSSVEEISQPKAEEEAGTSKPRVEEHNTIPYDTILNLFKKHGELTVQEVEKESGTNHAKVYYTLRKLGEDGKIFEIKKGKYQYIGE